VGSVGDSLLTGQCWCCPSSATRRDVALRDESVHRWYICSP
jgi:hypothetical protein